MIIWQTHPPMLGKGWSIAHLHHQGTVSDGLGIGWISRTMPIRMDLKGISDATTLGVTAIG